MGMWDLAYCTVLGIWDLPCCVTVCVVGLHNQRLRAFLPISAKTTVILSRYISQYPAEIYKEPGTIALTISSHSEPSFPQFCGYTN